MRKAVAAAGSALFFACVPAVVGGLMPGLLVGWHGREPRLGGPFGIALGVVLVCAGAAVMVHAFVRFVREGLGTPAPMAPTEVLVVGGLYRYLRNPMYVAVLAAIIGQAIILQRPAVWLYAVAVAAAVAAFVRGYEEPTLARRYGEQYETYRRTVPAWIPRPRPHPGRRRTPGR